jgi:hypothetical protein
VTRGEHAESGARATETWEVRRLLKGRIAGALASAVCELERQHYSSTTIALVMDKVERSLRWMIPISSEDRKAEPQ